jgi:tripartite-type tricarboxylate transporter receptor subunit TctC
MLLAPLGLGLGTIQADAQAWPTRPIHAIVAAGAGSTIDIVPRIVFEQLTTQLGQPIVVEFVISRESCRSGSCRR